MAFALRNEKPVAKTLRRLLRKQIGKAIESVKARRGARQARVHEARTSLKKGRAARSLSG